MKRIVSGVLVVLSCIENAHAQIPITDSTHLYEWMKSVIPHINPVAIAIIPAVLVLVLFGYWIFHKISRKDAK